MKKFNGKPMEHWELEAKKYVIWILVRASLNCDANSIIGRIASKELMTMALSKDRVLVQEALEERDNCLVGLKSMLDMCLPSPPKKKRKKPKK